MKKVWLLVGGVVILGVLFCEVSPKPDPRLSWEYEASSVIRSSVALGEDGTIYFASNYETGTPGDTNGYFYALSPDGTLKWKTISRSWDFSSPVVGSDGTVYFGSGDGYLYALNPDGSIKWDTLVAQDGSCSTPCLGQDGTIYLDASRTLYAFTPEGRKKWSYDNAYGPVVGSDGSIYCYSEGEDSSSLIALTPEGGLKWQLQLEGNLVERPAIGSSGTICLGTFGKIVLAEGDLGHFYAISPEGVIPWDYSLFGGFISSAVLGADGSIYACAEEWDYAGGRYELLGSYMYSLSAKGELLWRCSLPIGIAWSTPTVGSEGTVYVAGDSVSFAHQNSCALLCAVSMDGIVTWRFEETDGFFSESSPAIGSDGTIYMGGSKLHAIESDSKGLASSPWPKQGHDNQNTGRAR